MKPPICFAYMNINKVATIMILLATKDIIAQTHYRFKYLNHLHNVLAKHLQLLLATFSLFYEIKTYVFSLAYEPS